MNRNRRRAGLCMPGYNWCGPGCSGPGYPTNDVDSCCMQHDICYRTYGNRRVCDQIFLDCLHYKRNRYTKKGRDAAFFYNLIKAKNALWPF